MWDWLDQLGAIVLRASLAAAFLSSLVVLAMLGCRQPARRIVLARAAVLGVLVLIPLMGIAPLPRFDVVRALREASILPHPALALVPALPTATAGGFPGGRGLLGIYLAGVGIGLAGLALGYWGLGWLLRHSTDPSPHVQALYEAIPFPDRAAWSRSRSRPRLRVSTRIRGPVLLGVIRPPAIVIPAALDREAAAGDPGAVEALRLSFLHELAHTERLDSWFSLLGSLAQALWFFLPPIWWIRSRMHLDHEFLADRRAARDFGPREQYASALVAMAGMPADPAPARAPAPAPACGASRPVVAVPADAGSPLFQRVLMLVQCPFPVEPHPPAWWRWSLPLLAVLTAPAAACLCLGLDLDLDSQRPAAPPPVPQPQCFQMARLALNPQKPGPSGRVPVLELPLVLPRRFELSVDIWGDRTTLARCRVVGQQLGPADSPAEPEPEAWHHVRLQRDARDLCLWVDGRPVPSDPGPSGLTSRLCVEPAPDRPALFRNLRVTW
jgi:beta-lactamase regulating signal transducer with metallopeptidase domain